MKKNSMMLIALTVVFIVIGIAVAESNNQQVIFLEGFENWNDNNWIVETDNAGTYAIADDHYFEGQYSFQAGPGSVIFIV